MPTGKARPKTSPVAQRRAAGIRVASITTSTVSVFLLLGSHAVRAQTTWKGTGGNSNWGTTANWNPATVPNNTNTAIATFVSGVANLSAILDANYGVRGLVFNKSGVGANSAFTISGAGRTLTIGLAGITNNTAANQTISTSLALAANATFVNNLPGGSLTLSGTSLNLGTFGLTVDSTDNTVSIAVSGVISGTGSLTETGGGTLTLTGANTYSGGTTVGTMSNNGRLNVGVMGGSATTASLGTGAVSNFGLLIFYAGSSAGNASITNNAGGGLVFNNTSTAGNASITNNGEVDFYNTSTAGSATIANNGILDISGLTNGGISIGALSGAGTVALGAKALTVGGLGTSTAIDGVISGTSGSFIKTGTGTLTLTGANDYSGGTTISAGTLNVGVMGGSGTTARLGTGAVSNNATLQFYASSTAGSDTITNNGLLSFRDTSTANSATITNNGSLAISSLTSGGISIGALSGAGAVTLGNKALTVGGLNTSTTVSGVISGTGGSFIKTGTGTLTLTGANTYSGGTTVSVGTLVAGGSALGTGAVSVASGGTLAVGQAVNATLSPLAGGAKSLSVSSLSANATAGNTTPFLTFNLFADGTSDTLNLTGTGIALSFSSANGAKFIVGFASGNGSVLSGAVYNLITFTNPSASDTSGFDLNNANNSFSARGVGNFASTTGNFQWTKAGNGNVTGLQYVLASDATTPEPASLLLMLCSGGAAIPFLGLVVGAKGRQRQPQSANG